MDTLSDASRLRFGRRLTNDSKDLSHHSSYGEDSWDPSENSDDGIFGRNRYGHEMLLGVNIPNLRIDENTNAISDAMDEIRRKFNLQPRRGYRR